VLPLHDDNPTRRRPVITWALIGICVLVYLWQNSLGAVGGQKVVLALGAIPSVVLGAKELPPELSTIPGWATVLTSMFLHGGWMHLLGNMLYLWIFGNNVEDAMSRPRFIVFYVLCGVAAVFGHILVEPSSDLPMVGASGAIAGVLGAYILLHPFARVLVWVGFFVLPLPALVVLGIWFVMQFAGLGATEVGGGGVAYGAHVGGFIAGVLLILVFKRREVPLFAGKAKATPTVPGAPPPPPRPQGMAAYRPYRTRSLIPTTKPRDPNRGPPNRGPWG